MNRLSLLGIKSFVSMVLLLAPLLGCGAVNDDPRDGGPAGAGPGARGGGAGGAFHSGGAGGSAGGPVGSGGIAEGGSGGIAVGSGGAAVAGSGGAAEGGSGGAAAGGSGGIAGGSGGIVVGGSGGIAEGGSGGIAAGGTGVAGISGAGGGAGGVSEPTMSFVLSGRYGYAVTDVADVNGDGKPDLLNVGTNAQVWLGRGDGTFSNTAVVTSLGWSSTLALYIGHFDMKPGADIGSIEVLPNKQGISGRFASGQSDGTFRQPTLAGSVSNFANWFLMGPGDFTGDGFDDLLVVAGACGGIGSDQCTGTPTAPAYSYYVASVEYDGAYGFSTFRGTAGTIAPKLQGLATVFRTSGAGISDLDGDGKLDFILNTQSALYGGMGAGQQDSYIVYGKGDGTFDERGARSFTPGNLFPGSLLDLEGDRFPDLLLSNPSRVQWNNGGTFATAVPLPYQVIGVGDFDGDGARDLWTWFNFGYAAVLGDGHRGFGAPFASVSLSGGSKMADIDLDGTTDLVIVTGSTTSVYLSTAKKPFAGPADVQCGTCTGPSGF